MVSTLVKQDLYHAFKSTRGLLFLVFFGVFWLWLFSKLSGGAAQWLANPEGNVIIGYLFDPEVARSLFVGRSPTLSAFYLLAISTMPMFVLFAASDQTANDIGSLHMRFLIPRCHRGELFIARFFGACLLVALAYAALTVVALFLTLVVDSQINTLAVISDALLAGISLIVYAIPFIALMSLCSVIVGSAGLSALVGICVYVVILVVVSVIGIKMPHAADTLAYMLPNATKPWFIQLNATDTIIGALLAMVYVTIYCFIGWKLFQRRDI